ncbi:hypothetical protein [Sandarakinorhabdus sp.]|uniref:hypothetical protein n=1 Tax=Sandarakinorhabdus sp. TaxID=1916663 RepID=UPI003F6FD6A8
MAEVDNLVLEMLRGIRSDVAAIRDVQREHGVRLAELGTTMAGLRRDTAGDAEVTAHLAVRIDRLRDEVDRIKRRLEIAD